MAFSRDGQLFRVGYDAAADMSPDQQAELIQAMRRAAGDGPISLLFVVGEDARVIDPRVPGFWLDRVREPSLRIDAMAIASSRLAVRIAASAFARASGVLGLHVKVRAFSEEPDARAWLAAGAL